MLLSVIWKELLKYNIPQHQKLDYLNYLPNNQFESLHVTLE